ncbi:hypothetical protein ACFE04_005938 [Oxalis oulophora]
MSAKSAKSALSETPSKLTPTKATPNRSARLSRAVPKSEADSPSPLQNHKSSVEKSPRLVTSKSTTANRQPPPKTATPPERPRASVVKSSELQAQLTAVQEDLKKAKGQIALVEKEKAQAADELKEALRVAEEANGKLSEALVAEKRAQENFEIEKFRAFELEQAGIEATQKKEEEWRKEIENVRNQHALDVANLLSATQELQKLKQELAETSDAKNQALTHADDATKIAENHAEQVESLSAELAKLKAILDSTCQTEADEYDKVVFDLKSEINALKQELGRKKDFEKKFVERETVIEQLNVELEAARVAESYNHNLVEEWQIKVEKLEKKAAKANKLERSASESLESVMKQLEGNNDLLHNAESEIERLKQKVGLMEMTIKRQKVDLEESDYILNLAKEESEEISKKFESLKSELEIIKEEKSQALNNEKLAASSVQNLLEEKNKLINELDISREEEEKSKKAMESLASALHEVSVESREAKEKMLSFQTEHESYKNEVEDLKMVLKATNEKYENMLDDSKHEIDLLTESFKHCEIELMNTKSEFEQKELNFVNRVRETVEENTILKNEVDRVVNLLKQANDETCAAKNEEARLNESLKEVEAEIIHLQEVLGEAKAESMKLKESLLDKETEMQSIFQENEELRAKEAAARQHVDELSKLLEESTANKQTEANGDFSDTEKEYDLLPKVVEFSEENGHSIEEKTKELLTEEPKNDNSKTENHFSYDEAVETPNGKPKDDETKEKEEDSVEIEYKMWESCKIEKKDFESKLEEEGGEDLDEANGLTSVEENGDGGNSPTKQLKKKKPLFGKFGSLLKSKKGNNNQR